MRQLGRIGGIPDSKSIWHVARKRHIARRRKREGGPLKTEGMSSIEAGGGVMINVFPRGWKAPSRRGEKWAERLAKLVERGIFNARAGSKCLCRYLPVTGGLSLSPCGKHLGVVGLR